MNMWTKLCKRTTQTQKMNVQPNIFQDISLDARRDLGVEFETR